MESSIKYLLSYNLHNLRQYQVLHQQDIPQCPYGRFWLQHAVESADREKGSNFKTVVDNVNLEIY